MKNVARFSWEPAILVYMSKRPKTTGTPSKRNAWSAEDRQAFADGNRTRAVRMPDRRKVASRKACRKGEW